MINEGNYLKTEWLEDYRNSRSIYWREIVRLHANLDISFSIANFPFHMFPSSIELSVIYFFEMVEKGLYDSCVMIIWRLLFDSSRGKTLRWFKNEIMKNFQSSDYPGEQKRIRREMKKLNTEGFIRKNWEKYRFVRHTFLGHQKSVDIDPKDVNLDKLIVTYEDMFEAKNLCVSLFDILCMGYSHNIVMLGYYDDDQSSYIKKLLERLVLESEEIRYPENNQPNWPKYRARLTKEQLKFFNRFRRKLSLPVVK